MLFRRFLHVMLDNFATFEGEKNVDMKNLLYIFLWALLPIGANGQADRPAFVRFTTTDGLQTGQVRLLETLPNGQVFVATEGMFYLSDGQRFLPLDCRMDSIRALPRFGNHAVLWQGDSLLWVKDYYSLYLFDARSRRFRYDYEPRLSEVRVHQFVNEDGDSAAQVYKDLMAPHWPPFVDMVVGTPLDGEQLSAWCRDRQGGQWFGTRSSGILYVRPERQRVELVQATDGDVVRRMAMVDRDHMLVAGEHFIGLFDCRERRVVQTLATGNISCSEMQADAQGRIFVCTSQGLYVYADGQLSLYDTGNSTGLLHNHMRVAQPLDTDRVLLCNVRHSLGYFSLRNSHMQLLSDRIPSLENYRIVICATPLRAGSTDEVLVCTQNGAFVLNTVEDTIRSFAPAIEMERYTRKYNACLRDTHGRLWLGTQNGLLLVDGQHTRRLTEADGLSNSCIQSLAEDRNGRLWVGTSQGIDRIELSGTENDRQVSVRWLGASEGVPAVELMERGVCMMPDGQVWFATPLGMVTFSTDGFSERLVQPSCVLVGLRIGGEEMPLDTLTLSLDHNQNYLELRLSALNYATPEHTQYRYRLLGLEREFTLSYGAVADVRYNALRPGTYTFEVQASLGDGEWGPTWRKTFVVRPPWWTTWWALVLYVLVGLALAFWLLHNYWQKRQARLERENEQRVNQLFELREEARRHFVQAVGVDSSRIGTNAEEEKLVQQMMKYIEQNLDNADYTVDLLARDIGMSRANLYKRMQTLLGITPNEFMRSVRLKRAAQLLTESSDSVAKIGQRVGFQTPRYFSQCFTRLFGVTPKEYREGKTADEA